LIQTVGEVTRTDLAGKYQSNIAVPTHEDRHWKPASLQPDTKTLCRASLGLIAR